MLSGDTGVPAALPALALTFVLLTAGCVALPNDGPTTDDLEDQLSAAEPPADVAATVTVQRTIDGETTASTEDVWLRADGAARIETGTTGSEVIIVDEGERRWHYDASANWATRLETDPSATPFLEGLYAQQERYFDAYDVAEIEKMTLDGRETYRVAFDPPDNETIDRSISVLIEDTEYVVPLTTSEGAPVERGADRVEVWYDQATLFPVKHAIEGDGIEFETTYRDLAIDEGIDDERFAFDPAAVGADEGDVEDVSFPSIESYEAVDEAAEAVPFAVAEPPADVLPAGVELDSVTGYEFPDENRTQVSLQYRTDDGGTVAVTTSDGPRRFATGGDAIAIGSATGTIAETDEGTELQWSCGDRYYSVFVDRAVDDGTETAVTVGESLPTGC